MVVHGLLIKPMLSPLLAESIDLLPPRPILGIHHALQRESPHPIDLLWVRDEHREELRGLREEYDRGLDDEVVFRKKGSERDEMMDSWIGRQRFIISRAIDLGELSKRESDFFKGFSTLEGHITD